MKISGLPNPCPATPGAARTGRAGTAKPLTHEAQAPAPTFDPAASVAGEAEAQADAPADGRSSGLVGAAAHSHRSDVAALRQWINHPDLRDALGLPDLTGEHQGNGFAKAVEAYQSVAPVADPPAEAPTTVVDPLLDPTLLPDTGVTTGD